MPANPTQASRVCKVSLVVPLVYAAAVNSLYRRPCPPNPKTAATSSMPKLTGPRKRPAVSPVTLAHPFPIPKPNTLSERPILRIIPKNPCMRPLVAIGDPCYHKWYIQPATKCLTFEKNNLCDVPHFLLIFEVAFSFLLKSEVFL